MGFVGVERTSVQCLSGIFSVIGVKEGGQVNVGVLFLQLCNFCLQPLFLKFSALVDWVFAVGVRPSLNKFLGQVSEVSQLLAAGQVVLHVCFKVSELFLGIAKGLDLIDEPSFVPCALHEVVRVQFAVVHVRFELDAVLEAIVVGIWVLKHHYASLI